jgi:glycosyltransferase involved in cell wall biosynthesis
MKSLRIVWYRSEAILEFGGGERVLLEGLRCFRQMGAQITLLLPEPVSSEFCTFFDDYHSEIQVVPGFDKSGSSGWLSRIVQLPRQIRNLHRAIRLLAPDVIIANEQNEAKSLWTYSLAGLIGLPPIVTFVHGSPFQFPTEATKYTVTFRRKFMDIWANDPVYRQVVPVNPPAMGIWQRIKLEINSAALRAGVRMCRQILVLSYKNRNEVMLLYGSRHVEVICPGGYSRKDLELSVQKKTPSLATAVSRPILLSICRLISKKRVDLIIRAFGAFLDREPLSTASLAIGGTGSEEGVLRDLTQALGLTDRVRFLGFIPDSELGDWYAACDLFVSTDNADYDLTVMMALPKGKKILVTTQYEIPKELVSLRRCFFAGAATPDSLAAKIAQALATPLVPLGEVDFKELRSMTWETYFAHILDRLQSIVRVVCKP